MKIFPFYIDYIDYFECNFEAFEGKFGQVKRLLK
jgi:hypothetical protein